MSQAGLTIDLLTLKCCLNWLLCSRLKIRENLFLVDSCSYKSRVQESIDENLSMKTIFKDAKLEKSLAEKVPWLSETRSHLALNKHI